MEHENNPIDMGSSTLVHYPSITPQITVHGNRTSPNAPNLISYSLLFTLARKESIGKGKACL